MNHVQVLEAPVKSKGDKKNYRLIQLQNGLKALLIHKAESKESNSETVAAVSLAVGVGSYDEPVEIGGLAHFLEHLLFMGSSKYPEESGFNNFITANGGMNNAMTDNEFTVYYFDVSDKAFPEALDRFSQQFISPLLLQDSLQREREVVDSEYHMASTSDQVRLNSFFKIFIQENHPASFFEYGNLRTLKDETTDDELHSAVQEFFQRYVANAMFLTVQSKRPLNELQELVVRYFATLRNGVAVNRTIQNVDDTFKPQFFEKMFFVKPVQDFKNLYLTWFIKSVDTHYKLRPMQYIKGIFANEGEGGVIDVLRDLGLAVSVELELDSEYPGVNLMFTLIKIKVELTNHGLKNIPKVLEKIFSYLLMLKETSIEDHLRLYNDYKKQSENNFMFYEEREALENVSKVSVGMKQFEDVDILRGDNIYQDFNSMVITDIINVMNQRKFNLMILSDDHDNFDKKEKYFGLEYDEIDFPQEYQKLWNERKLSSDFFLEKPNPFRSSNFEIFVNASESPKYPKKIIENRRFDVWHKLDNRFKIPHANVLFRMIFPKFMMTLHNSLLLKLFQKISVFSLAKKIFPATSAGLSVAINQNSNCIELKFKGYNEKLPLLIDMVTKGLKNIAEELDESVFEMQKQELKMSLSNSLLDTVSLCTDQIFSILMHNHWNDHQNYKEIEKVTFKDMQNFSQNLFKKMKVQALMQGNITKIQVERVIDDFARNFNFEPLEDEKDLKGRGYQLPLGTNFLRTKSLLLNDDNSLIEIFYQIGTESIRLINLLLLLKSTLNPKAFETLRTKEQLGYSVGIEVENHVGILGLSIYVSSQESKHSHSEVYEKIETFMNENAKTIIENLTDEEFESHQESRKNLLLAEDLDLEDEVGKNWKEIKDFNYVFNRSELAAKVTSNLTKSDLQELFTCITDSEKMRKLSVQVIGYNEVENEQIDNIKDTELEVVLMKEKLTHEENVIVNVDEFRRNLLLYPSVKSQIIFIES